MLAKIRDRAPYATCEQLLTAAIAVLCEERERHDQRAGQDAERVLDLEMEVERLQGGLAASQACQAAKIPDLHGTP